MQNYNYDITYDDLNPTVLFASTLKRVENEENYHSHDHIELCLAIKGSHEMYVDGKNYLLKEGDLMILNPGTYHRSLASTDQGPPVVECYIGFSGIHLRGQEPNHMMLPGGKQIYELPLGLKQDIFKICAAMEKESGSCKAGRYFMLKSYVIQIICLLIREEHEKAEEHEGYIFKSTNKKYVVKQIKKYLEEHYQEKISLDTIAQNMYLSTFYISKLFKNETGDTPINYLIQIRMEKAGKIIKEGKAKSIQDVAAMVGYEDAYHFSKLFKKYYGMSPSSYVER